MLMAGDSAYCRGLFSVVEVSVDDYVGITRGEYPIDMLAQERCFAPANLRLIPVFAGPL